MTGNRRSPWVAMALGAVLAFACSDDPSEPGSVVVGHFAIAPSYQSPHAGIIDVQAVRITLAREGEEGLRVDTTLVIAPEADSIDLVVEVTLQSAEESFLLNLALIDAAGDTVFRGGPLTVIPTDPSEPPPVLDVPIQYTGTGADAVDLTITSTGTFMFFGDTIALSAVALDAAGEPIAGTPMVWTSLDTSLVHVLDDAAGLVAAGSQRGTGTVLAELLTGPADTGAIAVQPLPSVLAAESGDGQSADVGTALPAAIVTRVTATDGLGVQGVRVGFVVLSGGGTLSNDTVLTDTQGLAGVQWTLGTTAGQQEVTAAAPDIAEASVTFLSTAQPGPVAAVTVTPAADSLFALGATTQFTAQALDAFGNGATTTFAWSSADTLVATVNAAGLTTATGSGTTTITATSAAGPSAQAQLTVVAPVRFDVVLPSQFHTCGLTVDFRAFCWGANTLGQLGDGTTTDRLAPVPVTGGLRFTSLSVGFNHTCGVATDATAYCWGSNRFGQLGTGTPITQSEPTAVSGAGSYQSVEAGFFHTCALDTGGAAHCWGDNFNGQLGTGLIGDTSLVPAAVSGGLTFTTISAGRLHSCALDGAGAAHCWGDNSGGQLGDTAVTVSPVPVPVLGGRVFRQLSAGETRTCALDATDAAFCWNGIPVREQPTLTFTWLSVGAAHQCGTGTDLLTYCWGGNQNGQLGGFPVTGSFDRVSAGGILTCALDANPTGDAYCWGWNNAGQLGDGTTTNSTVPVRVLTPP